MQRKDEFTDFGPATAPEASESTSLEHLTRYDARRDGMFAFDAVRESEAKQAAIGYDRIHQTQIVDHAGPEVSDRTHRERIAVDGQQYSSSFHSYRDLVETRNIAEQRFLQHTLREDITSPPRPGESREYHSYSVHSHAVGYGFMAHQPAQYDGVYTRQRDDGAQVTTQEPVAPSQLCDATVTRFVWDSEQEQWLTTEHAPFSRQTHERVDASVQVQDALQERAPGKPMDSAGLREWTPEDSAAVHAAAREADFETLRQLADRADFFLETEGRHVFWSGSGNKELAQAYAEFRTECEGKDFFTLEQTQAGKAFDEAFENYELFRRFDDPEAVEQMNAVWSTLSERFVQQSQGHAYVCCDGAGRLRDNGSERCLYSVELPSIVDRFFSYGNITSIYRAQLVEVEVKATKETKLCYR